MSLTVSLDMPKAQRLSRDLYMMTGSIAFDSSYAYGGESLTANTCKLKSIKTLTCQAPGYLFDYDVANSKIKVYANAPPIVYEEKHTAVANSVTLDYPAAWIINVCTAGQNEALTARADTLSDNECKLASAIADGVRTEITTYGETDTIYVTYVTQAWAELYACLVQEESVDGATGANNLANTMMAFGYCYGDTTGRLVPVDIADTTADGEVGIKMGYATGALDLNSAQNGETLTVTYLKKPESGWIADRFVSDEDPTQSGSDPYLQTFDLPCLVWCITGALTANGETTLTIIESDATPASGEINTNWGYQGPAGTGAAPTSGHVWGGKDDVTVTAGAYIFGHPWEIPGLVPLEVKNGTDLSGLSAVKFTAVGLA